MPCCVSRGSLLPVLLVLIGLGLGLVCFASSASGAPEVERRIYAGTFPAPADITAYVTAISGALVTAVNTALLIWHKLSERRRPRRKRKVRPGGADGTHKADAPSN